MKLTLYSTFLAALLFVFSSNEMLFASQSINQKVLFIIPPENFYTDELYHPLFELGKSNIGFDIASTKTGKINGVYFDPSQIVDNPIEGYVPVKGAAIAQKNIDNIDIKQYAAVVVVGGGGTPATLWDNEILHKLLNGFAKQGKIISGICAGSVAVGNSGILSGKKATTYNDDLKNGGLVGMAWADELTKKGAIFLNQAVVQDGNIVTANGPIAAEDFGRTLVKLLLK